MNYKYIYISNWIFLFLINKYYLKILFWQNIKLLRYGIKYIK